MVTLRKDNLGHIGTLTQTCRESAYAEISCIRVKIAIDTYEDELNERRKGVEHSTYSWRSPVDPHSHMWALYGCWFNLRVGRPASYKASGELQNRYASCRKRLYMCLKIVPDCVCTAYPLFALLQGPERSDAHIQ